MGLSAEPSRSTSPSASADLVPSPQPPSAKKKKMSLGEEVDVALLRSLKDLEERRARRHEQDEEELFGKHIAAVLRRFSPRQRAQARLRIEQVLIDVEFPDDTHTHMQYSDMTSFRY